MEEIRFADITTAYVGRTDQSGWRITWVAGHGTDRHSIGVVHDETGKPQVWELLPQTIVWLRSRPLGVPHLARWTRVAEQVAREVTSS